MTKSILSCGAACVFAVMSPVLVRAQFQQPTDEQLKMTSDSQAPGAAAVYLDIEEIANDPMHYQSYYAEIKVLTEKGKELATQQVPYLRGGWKITDIKGRTIHPDGTVIPLTVKPEDLLSEKSGEKQFGRKVFTLPSVEVGSILQYSYTIRYDDNEFSAPEWEIQRPYFVHKAHYQFTPFKQFMPTGTPDTATSEYLTDSRGRVVNSLMWWHRLPPNAIVKTSVNGSYSLDLTDIPPIPDEEWMPPIRSFLYRVFFYYMAASNPTEFWMNESKWWEKDVDKFAEPSQAIRNAVNGIISPNDSEDDKAKKLYAAVQTVDNTDYSRRKTESEMKELKLKQAKHAEDTWKQKSGSSEDIAMLYLAMLRAAGLTAYPLKIVDRDRGVFDPSYMNLDQLDSTLVALSDGGKQIVLDPGEEMCPFGSLNWRHSDARGIAESSQGISIAVTPSQFYRDNDTQRVGDVNLDVHGAVTGNFTFVMKGQEALRWRQAALRVDETELKKQFDEELERIEPEGVKAHVDHFVGMDNRDISLLAIVKVDGTMGTTTAKRLLLPGFFFANRLHQPFVNEEKRMEPVDMRYGDRVTEQVTYHLPEGMTVEAAPQDANVSWTGHSLLVAKSITKPGEIVVGQTLSMAFTQVKPEEYQDLRGFYQKVAAVDQEQIVLSNVPAAAEKGN